jgi:hypothetical protein
MPRPWAAILFLFLLFSGCAERPVPAAPTAQLDEIAPVPGDTADLRLAIVGDMNAEKNRVYTLKGIYKGAVVGLKLELRKTLKPGLTPAGEPNEFLRPVTDGARIYATGPESDLFLRALSELFGMPTDRRFTKSVLRADPLSLDRHPVDLDSKKGRYTVRLFFNYRKEDLSAELDVAIDLDNGTVSFTQRDEVFRATLLTLFTK